MLLCVPSSEEAISIFERAGVDEGSSRSHAIAIVYVEQRCKEGAPSTGTDLLKKVGNPPPPSLRNVTREDAGKVPDTQCVPHFSVRVFTALPPL